MYNKQNKNIREYTWQVGRQVGNVISFNFNMQGMNVGMEIKNEINE